MSLPSFWTRHRTGTSGSTSALLLALDIVKCPRVWRSEGLAFDIVRNPEASKTVEVQKSVTSEGYQVCDCGLHLRIAPYRAWSVPYSCLGTANVLGPLIVLGSRRTTRVTLFARVVRVHFESVSVTVGTSKDRPFRRGFLRIHLLCDITRISG